MTDPTNAVDALSELQLGMARALRHGSSISKDAAFSAFALEHIAGNDRVSPV